MPSNFAQPLWFLALLLLPLFWVLRGKVGPRSALLFSSFELLASQGEEVRRRSGRWAYNVLPSLAFLCWVIALARPQEITQWQETKSSGIEIMIALDVSDSMGAVDFFAEDGRQTTRLEQAKRMSTEFIQSRRGDQIGLVVFAGQPSLLSPQTSQREFLIGQRLPLATTNFAQLSGGTAIGKAIVASLLRLTKSTQLVEANQREDFSSEELKQSIRGKAGSRIIVLVTDGNSNTGVDPIQAAEYAKELGVRIYTIAIGSPQAQDVFLNSGGRRRYANIAGYDEETLRRVAELTQGEFFRSSGTESLRKAFESVDELEKAEIETYTLSQAEEQFPFYLSLGIAFLCLSLLIHPLLGLRLPE